MKAHKRKAVTVIFLVFCILLHTGCGKKEIAFTTGLTKQELFKIDGKSCTMDQTDIILMNLQREYETLFGADNWSRPFGVGTLEDYVKEQTLKQLSQLKSLSIMASQQNITLTEQEEKEISSAAKEYMSLLEKHLPKDCAIKEKDVKELYKEYCLANKYYDSVIQSVNQEISDDEARIITVQHILFKTEKTDESGNKRALTENERNALHAKAYEVWQKATSGENFDDLAVEYSEDEKIQYTFGRGEMDEKFEEVAFNLKTGEISNLAETEYGIHIIKCILNYDEAQTSENKKNIYRQRCADALNQQYEEFISGVLVEFNEEAWEKKDLNKEASAAETPDLFAVYLNHLEAPLLEVLAVQN